MKLARIWVCMFTGWLAGCALLPERHHLIDLSPYPDQVNIKVPFYQQSDDLCGPAAMAMVMAWSGQPVDLAKLHAQIYTHDLGGSLQQDMLASARRNGLLAVSIDSVDALLQELSNGHPVILLLNLRLASWPQWHYVVVTGFDAEKETALIHDGQTANREIPLATLLGQWYRGERWGLVVTPPGQLPASADAKMLLQAAMGLERADQNEAALNVYRAATAVHQDHALLWLGRGNSALTTQNTGEAITAFHKTLLLDSQNGAAYHNLGLALLELGKISAALEAVTIGLMQANGFHEALNTMAQRLRQNPAMELSE